jgi:hypothetical protein
MIGTPHTSEKLRYGGTPIRRSRTTTQSALVTLRRRSSSAIGARDPPIWTPGLVASVTAVQRQNALICAAVFMANMLAGFRLRRMAGVAVR